MTATFQAFRMNRVWVVINNDTHEQVGGPFISAYEAERFLVELWREARPVSSLSEPMVWGDDWEGRLLAILDKPYESELLAAA
jgi:hypothetical protein